MCSCADPSRDVDCDDVLGYTPTPSTPTTAPTTTSSTTTSSTVGPDDVWVPRVGDTWQYNLNAPVDTNVDADVFFIDMGESVERRATTQKK